MRQIALSALLALLAGTAFAAEPPPQKQTIFAMGGIPINVSAWGMEQATFDSALLMIDARIEELEAMMDAAPSAAPSSAADEAYTKGLAQMRKSSKQMYEDDEE